MIQSHLIVLSGVESKVFGASGRTEVYAKWKMRRFASIFAADIVYNVHNLLPYAYSIYKYIRLFGIAIDIRMQNNHLNIYFH